MSSRRPLLARSLSLALTSTAALVGAALVGVPAPASAAPTACDPDPCTVTFAYTGGTQSWTVPDGVSEATFELIGGRGGTADHGGASGGSGGHVTATLPVTSGAVLTINVGGAGRNVGQTSGDVGSTGGWNGGGDSDGGGGGGGASDVRTGAADGTRLLVAGGGGGGGGAADSPGGSGGSAGHGGGNGMSSGYLGGGYGGGPGAPTAGGYGGRGGVGGADSAWGVSGHGSQGGQGTQSGGHSRAGGGGGGWYGGGSGGSGAYELLAGSIVGEAGAAGGGGGSSHAPDDATDVSIGVASTPGDATGNGRVVIQYSVVLEVTSADHVSWVVGQPSTFPITTNLTIDTIGWNPSTGVPSWLSSDLSPARISGTPSTGSVGTYTLHLEVTAGDLTGTQTITLTVAPAPVTVTAPDLTAVYGSPLTLTPSYSGLLTGESADDVDTPATCTADWAAETTSCSGAADDNYTFTYVDGTVDVTPAPLTITASDVTWNELGTPPTPPPVYDGLANGDTAPATPPTCTADPTTGTTSCTGAADPHYTISYVGGALTSTAPDLPGGDLPDAEVGEAYSTQIAGPFDDYAFSLAPGDELPAGLELSSSGELHGTPTEAGEYDLTITLGAPRADARARVAPRLTATYHLQVREAPAPTPTDSSTVGLPDTGAAFPPELLLLGLLLVAGGATVLRRSRRTT